MSSLIIISLIIVIGQCSHLRTEKIPVQLLNSWIYDRILAQSDICYGVMFDAGSSGTRVYVYNWACRVVQTMVSVNINEESPGKKIKPGIDSFANNLPGIQPYLQPLIDFAIQNVPSELQQFTPILLGATAGMRLLTEDKQKQIMAVVRQLFINSGFLFIDQEWARVISGQDEGAYMWLTTNYLLQNILPSPSLKTVLTIDIGGASTQIAFKPTTVPTNDTFEIDLRIPNFNEYDIYSTTYLGFGNDQARKTVIGMSVVQGSDIISTPCYHKGFNAPWEVDSTKTVTGTGVQEDCRNLIRTFLNSDATKCKFAGGQCSINNEFQPNIDLDMEVYGTGSAQIGADFFGFTEFTLPQFLENVNQFTTLTWDEVQANPDWAANPYVNTDYFLGLYIYELLKTGYKIPETTLIKAPELIEQNTPSWTLAGTFYQISQISCQYDSPVCSTLAFKESIFRKFI